MFDHENVGSFPFSSFPLNVFLRFRASRSNNFYLALLLTMLFLCVLPVSYAIVQMKPSKHCGPFTQEPQMYNVLTDTMRRLFPSWQEPLGMIASPSTIIPLLLLLILIIYYMIALTSALREANDDLRNQLRRERQEERRKMQRVVNSRCYDDNNGNTVMDRWRKVLDASSPLTPTAPSADIEEEKMKARREFLARIMKKALRKSSNTSEDESHPGADDDDETDTEQHESLPHDQDNDGHDNRRNSVRRRDSLAVKDEKKIDSHKSRKASFSRMSEIVELARQKSAEDKNLVTETRKEIPSKATAATAEEQDDKIRVVSERRQLRRQSGRQNSESSASLPTTMAANVEKDTTNYEVINEKNSALERKAKAKTKQSPVPSYAAPEVFKFDKGATERGQYGEKSDDRKNENEEPKHDEEVVLRPKKTIPPSSSPAVQHQKRTSSPIATSSTATKEDKTRKEEEPKTKSTDGIVSVSPKSPKSPKTPTEKEKSPDDVKNPRKKLNSFLALVREAVQARKQEQAQPSQTETNEQPDKAADIQSRVRRFIDDSNSTTTISEEGSRTSDSTRSGSSRRHRRIEPPKPKRQDSQTSIWSDNIPVITISKTESDECILEKDVDEAIPPDAPKSPQEDDEPQSE